MTTFVKREGKVLTIKLQMQKPVRSSSGKSLVVATTHGRITTEAICNKEHIVVNANAFIYLKNNTKKTEAEEKGAKTIGLKKKSRAG